MLRNIILLSLVILVSSLHAQSKKEMQAQVTRLQNEITELKKPKVITLDNEHKRISYGFGVLIANNLKSQGPDSLNIEALNAGLNDVLTGKTLQVDANEASGIVQQYMQQIMEAKAAKQKEGGVKFLEANAKNPDVKVLPSGLQYKVITSGTGKSPSATDRVTVHYTGKLIDGTVFDSSVSRGQPATFGVGQVIRGWTEALQLMKEGDKWMLYIPSDLGYGPRGSGAQIPPYSTLIFEVELIKVN